MRSATVTVTPGEAIHVPPRPGGGTYRYCMVFNGNSRAVYADKFEELCETLIPGFDLSSNDYQTNMDALVDFADAQHVVAQASLVATHPDPVDANDRDILTSPRHGPVPVQEWANPVPLVVCDIHYQDHPVPTPVGGGQVVVVRTGNPQDFIESFAQTGLISLLTAT